MISYDKIIKRKPKASGGYYECIQSIFEILNETPERKRTLKELMKYSLWFNRYFSSELLKITHSDEMINSLKTTNFMQSLQNCASENCKEFLEKLNSLKSKKISPNRFRVKIFNFYFGTEEDYESFFEDEINTENVKIPYESFRKIVNEICHFLGAEY